MKIVEKQYNWNGELGKRCLTSYIVLHHRGGDGDADSIHKQHISNGWSGIGYHFYIRKDGTIYRGRPIDIWGSHCVGYNDRSVGVCFEGNFEKDTMSKTQLKSGQELILYLKKMYPKAEIKQHKELSSTACPGKNFPLNEILKGDEIVNIEDAIKAVQIKAGLEDETIDFLLCYKYGEELIKKLAEAMI